MYKDLIVTLIFFCFFSCPSQGGISVHIDGAIEKKGQHDIESFEPLSSLVYKCKLSDIVRITWILVSRMVDEKVVHYRVDIKKLLRRSLDFKLKNGDKIFIPERGAALPPFAKVSILVE